MTLSSEELIMLFTERYISDMLVSPPTFVSCLANEMEVSIYFLSCAMERYVVKGRLHS